MEESELLGMLLLEQGKPDWASNVASYKMQYPDNIRRWVLELDAPPSSAVSDLFFGVRLRILLEYPDKYPFEPPRLTIDEGWLQRACFGSNLTCCLNETAAEENAQRLMIAEEEGVSSRSLVVETEKCCRKNIDHGEKVTRKALVESEFPAYVEYVRRLKIEEEAAAAYAALEVKFSESHPKYHVFVKFLTGKVARIRTHAQMTVDELKAAVRDAEGIPEKNQRLLSNGKQLELGRSLRDYNVESGSTVHLVLISSMCPCAFMSELIGEWWSPALTIVKVIEDIDSDDETRPFRACLMHRRSPCSL